VQNPISLNTPFLYIHFQRFSLLLLNFPDLSSFSLAFGFFFSGFPLWFFIYGFFISFLPSPSPFPGDYFFRYVDYVYLIYDFFVPPHKNENFFCFSYQSFVLFMFLPFICFFVVHMVDSVFFLLLLTASKWYSSTLQFLQQSIVEVEWIFKHQGEIFSFLCSFVLMFFFSFFTFLLI